MKTARESGFTLIELMVALFIFGVLAASGVALLSFSVRAQGAAGNALAAVAADRRLSALLTADLAQALPRVTRDAGGNSVRAFTGYDGRSSPQLLEYVRGGWTNPDGAPRPGLQRVIVSLNDGRLERRSYPMIDGASTGVPTLLASNVESVQLRYRDKRSWRSQWDELRADSLPLAVELTFKRRNQPALLMGFLVGVSYP